MFGVLTKEKAIRRSEKRERSGDKVQVFTPIVKALDSILNVMESSLSRVESLANPCYLPICLSAHPSVF